MFATHPCKSRILPQFRHGEKLEIVPMERLHRDSLRALAATAPLA